MTKADRCQIPIAEAERVAKKYNLSGVVIIACQKNGEIGAVTYGESKFKCRVLGEWVKGFLEHKLSYCPFVTAFGWGNNGVPQRMKQEDYDSLNPMDQEYVDRNTDKDAVAS